MAETVLFALLKANLAAGAAILLMLALRPVLRRRLGAAAVWRMWLVVPAAAAAVLLPARAAPPAPYDLQPGAAVEEPVAESPSLPAAFAPPEAASEAPLSAPPARPVLPAVLIGLWLAGAAALLARAWAATTRLAADPAAGPALVGVVRPRLLLPADFERRFNALERALILAHEEAHRAGRHATLNALIELGRCLCWFNPLAHAAARRARADQELACDAAVMAAHPGERAVYARAMLKSQTRAAPVPLGCAWPGRSAAELRARIEMLGAPAPGRRLKRAGLAAVILLGAGAGAAAWAAQPPRVARPEPVWTPSSATPVAADGRLLLTELEAQRHDLFIDLAQRAASCPGSPRSACRDGEGIDIVFFGTTNTEMFWWPARGMPVWERTLGRRKAVNFGSQGTDPESLLWRMRNGELDGYRAKLVVLSAFCCIEAAVRPDARDDLIARYRPVLAEIRARQPQAKILILADFPRGTLSLSDWRQVAAANAAAHTPLIDNETVFWVDIGERFYRPDGAHDQTMWSLDVANRGIQAPAFEAWAEELEPWLQRFVD